MGRPKKDIDYNLIEKLASIQCTQEEISEIIGVSTRTLQRDSEFCRIYKKGIESGKMSLRRLQWKRAEEGNSTMLVWLGKQYLGQRDIPKEEEDNQALDRLVSALDKRLESETDKSS